MKKWLYIMVILLIIMFAFMFYTNCVYAETSKGWKDGINPTKQETDSEKTSETKPSKGWKDGINPTKTYKDWNEIYKKEGNAFDTAQNMVLGLVQAIGYIVSVLMVTIIGIKYIFTSPEGKAEVKKQLIPFLIGALLLFSGTVLVSTISKWAYTILN